MDGPKQSPVDAGQKSSSGKSAADNSQRPRSGAGDASQELFAQGRSGHLLHRRDVNVTYRPSKSRCANNLVTCSAVGGDSSEGDQRFSVKAISSFAIPI